MIIYLILSRCKLEHIVGELLEKAAEDATGKEVTQKLHALRNILLTIDEVLADNEAKKKWSKEKIIFTYVQLQYSS